MKTSVTEKGRTISVSPRVSRAVSLFVGEAVIVIFIGVIFRMMMGTDVIAGIYIDMWSVFPVFGMTFVVLAAAGLLKEFGCAFSYCIADASDIVPVQVKKAAAAVKLSMVAAVLTGVLMAIIRIIGLLYSPAAAEPEFLPLFLADLLVGILYGIVIAVLLLPIYGRLKKQMNTDE